MASCKAVRAVRPINHAATQDLVSTWEQQMHFAQAPHELPLLEDQEVAMRAWWRHPKTMEITDAAEEDGQAERLPGTFISNLVTGA
eukprot:scaffold157249_cov18-Tisochrysis_lutea.AAC.2